MTQLQIRPYHPGDADDVTALFNRVDVALGRPAALTASLLADFLERLVASMATDSQLVLAGTGVVAAGFVTTPPPGGSQVELVGAVLPQARGQGIGRSVLGWQVGRAEQIHAARAAGSPWQAHATVAQSDTPGLALLARFGFTPVRYSFDMVAATTGTEPRPIPDGVTIQAYRPEQSTSVHRAHMEAFADHWGHEYWPYETWFPLTLGSTNVNPALSVVALAGAEIAGYIIAYDDALAERIYIGQVGVRPPWRRQGLAAAMLSHVLRAAAVAGRSTAALDVDTASLTGAVGVYERVGFHTAHTTVVCSRTLTAG